MQAVSGPSPLQPRRLFPWIHDRHSLVGAGRRSRGTRTDSIPDRVAARDLRRRAWETTAKRRYQEKNRIDSFYDRLVKLRHRIARNAGYPNFRDFCHQSYDRFDYSPKDCFVFHDAVEKVVMPAVRKLRERRAREMGFDKLKPWDLAVDPLAGFERLYRRAGLTFTAGIAAEITRHSSGENPPELDRTHAVRLDSRASLGNWRRNLDESEIERVRAGTRDVAPAFYDEVDW